VVPAEAEDIPGERRNRSEESDALRGIRQLSSRQLLDRLVIHQLLAVLPRLARQRHAGFAGADQLEERPRKCSAPPPERAPLRGEILGQTAEVEHGIVPHGARLGLSAASAKRHEMHGPYAPEPATVLRGGSVLPARCAMSSSSRGNPNRTSSSTTRTSRTSEERRRRISSTTSVTRNSGVEAPAVTPTRCAPSSHSDRTSVLSLMRCDGVPITRETSTSRFAFELLAAPITRSTSTSLATVFTAACRF